MESAIIIEELLNIENRASQYIKDSEDAKKELPNRIAQYVENLSKQLDSEAKQRIDRVKSETNAELKLRLKEIEIDNKQSMHELERDFEMNRQKWEDEIFHKILGT